MKQDEVTSSCGQCGASVYKQHLDSGIARYEGDKLLCAHCVSEYERSHDATVGGEADVFAPIEFDDVDDHREAKEAKVDMSGSRIHAASAATLGRAGAWDDAHFKRGLQLDGTGAIRCRTFHCKLTEGAVEFMNNQVNEWLDQNEQITMKFATSTIGMFEGKHTEPNLIVTVFY